MRNGNNRKGSCLSNNQENSSSYCEQHKPVLVRFLNVPVLVLLIAITVIIILPSGVAFGQYMVQPVELKLPSRVNKEIRTALRIHSQEDTQNLEIELKVVELSQSPDSEWQIFDPDPNNKVDYVEGFDVSKLSSCSDWIRLSTSKVELGPLAEVPVEVIIRVPPRVHGFYSAGILTTYRVAPEGTDVGYLLRYLIPVLIEIQGRTIQPKIKLLNVNMEHVPALGDKEATTNVAVSVENIGDTYSRLKPMARLEGYQDGHWRLITRAEFRDTGIIPGSQLHLEADIMRALPSGKYKLAGAIYVDGRPGGAIQKEIDFVGDPSLNKAATDAPLDLSIADKAITEIIINGNPGSTRTQVLNIHNASDSTVNIQTLFALPTSLAGRASPAFRGESLGCPDWLRIEPSQIELGSYQDKRVRVIAEIPASVTDYPWHYAVLGLYAHYPDGQMAGLTTANVCVGEDRGMTPEVMVRATNLSIRGYDPLKSEFLVLIEFTNDSSTFFTPKRCKAGIVFASGQYTSQVRASTTMRSDQPGVILPLDTRRYSGVLDLSSVEAGNYRLEATLEYGVGQNIRKQCAIQVSIVNGRRLVQTIQTADEIAPNDIIEVNW
jgi:hypothetical protein